METPVKLAASADGTSHPPMPPLRPPHQVVDLRIPFTTYLKLASCLFLAWGACYLGRLMLLTLLAAMLAVTMDFFVNWLEKHGCKRGVALALVIPIFVLAILGAIGWILPTMVGQMADVVKELPRYKDELLHKMPGGEGFRRQMEQYLERMLNDPADNAAVAALVTQGTTLLYGLVEFLLLSVIAIYLLVDGRGVLRWLLAFFTQEIRDKFSETADEVSQVVSHYVAGQAITSIITFSVYYTILLIFKVPAAFSLAFLGGIADVIPLLGFVISLVPALLLALTVSPAAASWVLGLYLLYHVVENYFIVPRIYGTRMRLSTLGVLMGLIVGGTLAGVPGAIAVLPVLASYAIIERVWLKDFLGSLVVRKHEIQEVQEYGVKEHDKKEDGGIISA